MKKLSALALACAGVSLAVSPVAAAASASAPAAASTPAAPEPSATPAQSLAFQFVSARALDDATYGNAVEVKFTVTNTGTSDGPFSFHVLGGTGQNFLDDEGEEMYTGCDTAVSALRPGASTTCRTLIRMSASEVAAGVSTPQPIQFRWGMSGPTFPGFTVPAATLGGPAVTPAPAEKKSLAFAYRTAVAKNDATYGPAVEVTFDVTNTGTTPGPWEFHVLTADGKNFLDDEGQEMYTGCEAAISQLQPGATTTCRTFMRLSEADIARGESPAMPVTFQWGSTGPTFDGFTVPVLNLSHLAPTTPEPTKPTPTTTPTKPTKPTKPTPTTEPTTGPTKPAPAKPATPTPTKPAPAKPSATSPAEPSTHPAEPASPSPAHPSAPNAHPTTPTTPTTPASPAKPATSHPVAAQPSATGPAVQTDGVGRDDALGTGAGVAAGLTAVTGAAIALLRRRLAG